MNSKSLKILSALASGRFTSQAEIAHHVNVGAMSTMRRMHELRRFGVVYSGGDGLPYNVDAFGVFDPESVRAWLIESGYKRAAREITS